MKNTFGQSLAVTLFGESHGEEIGAVLDGIAPGIPVNEDKIRRALSLRRPSGALSTARVEADDFRFVSGVFRGKTTGTPLTILIKNENKHSADYENGGERIARPSHADYTAHIKYHGYEDYRGGGHFSGRLTAPLVALGAIVADALEKKGIKIGTHIAALGGVSDRAFRHLEDDVLTLKDMSFPVLSPEAAEGMQNAILAAKSEGDSVGGILESVVLGMPAGVGEPFFDSVESTLSHMLFSIPAVKGVFFGAGFGFADMRGSEANDAFRNENGEIRTVTNHNGGVLGGITSGMPLIFSTAVKPTPSIYKEQDSVSLSTGENAKMTVKGRHDPCIVHRAAAVVNACTALALGDLLALRFGTDYLSNDN